MSLRTDWRTYFYSKRCEKEKNKDDKSQQSEFDQTDGQTDLIIDGRELLIVPMHISHLAVKWKFEVNRTIISCLNIRSVLTIV